MPAPNQDFETYDRVIYAGPRIESGSWEDMNRIEVDSGATGTVVKVLKNKVRVAFRYATVAVSPTLITKAV